MDDIGRGVPRDDLLTTTARKGMAGSRCKESTEQTSIARRKITSRASEGKVKEGKSALKYIRFCLNLFFFFYEATFKQY